MGDERAKVLLMVERHHHIRTYFHKRACFEKKNDPLRHMWPVSYLDNVMVFCNLQDNNLWKFEFRDNVTVNQWSMRTFKPKCSQYSYQNVIAHTRLARHIEGLSDPLPDKIGLKTIYIGCIGQQLFFYDYTWWYKDYDDKIVGCCFALDYQQGETPKVRANHFSPRSKG